MTTDLPALSSVSAEVPPQSFRAALLEKERLQLERTNGLLREALAELLPLAGRAAKTPADDRIVERATRVLTLGGLL